MSRRATLHALVCLQHEGNDHEPPPVTPNNADDSRSMWSSQPGANRPHHDFIYPGSNQAGWI